MAKTLTVSRTLSYAGSFVKSEDHGSVVKSIEVPKTQQYTHGSGSNQCNMHVDDRRSLTATSENIDLQATLSDAFGDTIVFTAIKEITIRNLSTVSGENLTVSGNFMGAVLGATTHTITVPPGGEWHASSPIDGFTVTNTTQDTLTVDSGSDNISYDLVIDGVV